MVLAHALMARRSEFDRPPGAGLGAFFASRGWGVVSFDFRGHGDSVPHGVPGATGIGLDGRGARDVAYDDFVARDLPAMGDFARWQWPGLPLALVGHSLGGHVALAALGTGAVAADAVVGFAASIWLPELEASRRLWVAKRAVLTAARVVARGVGRLPARALRVGSDDETRGCIRDLERFARTGRWTSAAGGVDYLASLARVTVPVLQVVSAGDRFECPPESGRRFVARCGGAPEVHVVDADDAGGPAPTHMGLVTGGCSRRAWEYAESWLRRALQGRPGVGTRAS